jgi:hypothetical protein
MSRATILFLTVLLVVGGSSPVLAGAINDPASISFHITGVPAKGICNSQPLLTAASINAAECPGSYPSNYTVWALVCNGSDSLGIAGAGFGIEYGGNVIVNNWTRCADLDFPQPGWPASVTGNVITWVPTTNCQDETSEPFVPGSVIAVLGAFNVTVYGPDQFASTPRPGVGIAEVADCSAAETVISGLFPSHLGIAGFCTPGYSPCNAPTPVRETSWGRIKNQY